MRWQSAKNKLNQASATVFGEDCYVRGLRFAGIPSESFSESLGMESTDPYIDVQIVDIERLQIVKDDVITRGNELMKVNRIEPNRATGWARVQLVQ